MSLRGALVVGLILGVSDLAPAAGRSPYGGQVRIAYPSGSTAAEASLQDTLLEASLHGLTARGPCRLDTQGTPIPALARSLRRVGTQTLRLEFATESHASAVAGALARLSRPEAPSPYRSLLFPVRAEGRQLRASGRALDVPLAFRWPDLESALCHPALQVAGAGPFRSSAPLVLSAVGSYPEGRTYLDRIRLQLGDARGLERLWEAKQAQLVLGPAPSEAPRGAALQATYLAFSPRRVPLHFRQAFESAVDRSDLTRLFVSGPAVPMPHLLPPQMLGAAPAAPPAAPEERAARKVSLVYDDSLEDQRATAERIQVRLHERGYTVSLEPQPRAVLRRRWAEGRFELLLHTLLLPPAPALALAVVLDAGGRKDLLGGELLRLGMLEDAEARARKVRERALALAPSVPLVPLYAQALAARVSPEVENVQFDAQGLLFLDGASLAPSSP